MEARRLNGDEIKQQLEEIKGWRHQITEIPAQPQNKNIDMLFKMFPFSDYKQTREFVNKVADIAESLAHYPSVTFAGNYSTVLACTLDLEGLTEEDFALAKQIDAING